MEDRDVLQLREELMQDKLNGSSPVLFMLNTEYIGETVRQMPTKMSGFFDRKNGTYNFRVQMPKELTSANLWAIANQRLKNMAALMNYITREQVYVILTGEQRDGAYCVCDMRMMPGTKGGDISSGLFGEMVERLRRTTPESAALEGTEQPYAMRTEDEYEALMNICGNSLPAWVVKAYNRNKDIIRHGVGRSGAEERKHASRAQGLLMNIDWLPRVVSVPPAEEVRRILDEEFYGLEEVKERIMEIAAQIRRSGKLPKWGILLHGGAGVGKTSIAKAIARIFGLPLIRLDMSSVGGDAEVVSGSSRVFSNAKPGMLLEKMYEVRSSTAVLLANEVDKAREGKNGQSAADIMLSILDKTGFYENFLEETIPTDNLLAIGTCNDISRISKPMRDRFLVIDIAGYTPNEKKVIFNDYVFPAAKTNSGLAATQIQLEDAAVDVLVSEYALEPGARDLEQYAERFVGDYCRHADAEGDSDKVYTVEKVRALLGPGRAVVRRFAANPGQVNAAFYHEGKAYFFLVEAVVTPGKGDFKVLGPVGQTQQEYCKVAYWCVRNAYSNNVCDFNKLDVVVFVPQEIPDGVKNHVGFACYAAICSSLLKLRIAASDSCFVGGCDLNGSVYFDESNLGPLLQMMKAQGVSKLYAPVNTNRLIYGTAANDCCVTIVEAQDAKTLFTMAVSQSSLAS